jgi:nitrogen fixation protein FixH
MRTEVVEEGNDTHKRKRPRELTGRTVLFCLVAFFAVVGAANVMMIRAAVSTFGGIETENAYQAGLAFAREIAAVEAQEALHWNVSGSLTPANAGTLVEVIATDGAGVPLVDLQGTARLLHLADKRADHVVPLAQTGPGALTGRTDAVAGQWMLLIELSRDGNVVFRSRNRVFVR